MGAIYSEPPLSSWVFRVPGSGHLGPEHDRHLPCCEPYSLPELHSPSRACTSAPMAPNPSCLVEHRGSWVQTCISRRNQSDPLVPAQFVLWKFIKPLHYSLEISIQVPLICMVSRNHAERLLRRRELTASAPSSSCWSTSAALWFWV